jgi:hypothetical protein
MKYDSLSNDSISVNLGHFTALNQKCTLIDHALTVWIYTHFSATGLQGKTTDVEVDVDPSGVHINRLCTDPVK